VADIIISGSQYERQLISQRTRDVLAARRARRRATGRSAGSDHSFLAVWLEAVRSAGAFDPETLK
jgi:DNA invertase Pin-like site-specific DNA recombinase